MNGDTHRIWTAPTIIGVATLVCLVGALVAEDAWDWAASLVLFVVLAYAVGLGLRSYEARDRDARKS